MTLPSRYGTSAPAGTTSTLPSRYASTPAAGGTDLQALLAQLQAQGVNPDAPNITPWGLVGNLVSGVADMGQGIARLLGAGISDVGSAALEAATLGKAETDSNLLPVAKEMTGFTEHGFHPTESTIVQDFSNRYGSLLPGGRPASQFLQDVYDQPLAYLLDAASVAGVGAKAASLGGEAALGGRLTEAVNALKSAKVSGLPLPPGAATPGSALDIAAQATLGMTEGGVAAKAAKYAGLRKGLDVLAEEGSLSPIMEQARRLLPQQTYRVVEAGPDVASHFIPSTEAVNPLNRLFANPLRRAFTEPIDRLIGQVDEMTTTERLAAIENSTAPRSGNIATRDLYNEIIQGAEDLGMKRIDRPFLRKTVYPHVIAKRIEKTLAADNLRLREAEAKEMHDLIVQAAEEDVANGFVNMEKYDITSTGADVRVNGMLMEPYAEARFGMGGDYGKSIDLADAPDAMVDTNLDEAVREALAGDPLLERVDKVIEQLEEVRAKFNEPRAAAFDTAAEHGAIDRIIRGLHNAMRRRAAGYENPASKLMDHARVIDIENRLPRMMNFETTPTSYLDRVYGTVKQKYLTGGLRATNPALSAKATVLSRVEELSKLEYEMRSLLNRRTQKGMIRTVRKLLGEERYAGARSVLESMSDDPAALAAELVRRDPEGGILKQLLDRERVAAYSKPGRPNTVETSVGEVLDVRQLNRAKRHPVGEAQAIWDTIDGLPADEATKNALRERYRVWASEGGTDAQLEEIYRDIGRGFAEPQRVPQNRLLEPAPPEAIPEQVLDEAPPVEAAPAAEPFPVAPPPPDPMGTYRKYGDISTLGESKGLTLHKLSLPSGGEVWLLENRGGIYMLREVGELPAWARKMARENLKGKLEGTPLAPAAEAVPTPEPAAVAAAAPEPAPVPVPPSRGKGPDTSPIPQPSGAKAIPASEVRKIIEEKAGKGTVTRYTESLPAPEAPLGRAPTAVKESQVGVAMTLQGELQDAIGDPAIYEALFSGPAGIKATDTTRSIMKRLREVLADPVATQRNALRGLDDSPDSMLLDDAFVNAGLEQPTYFPYIRDEGKTGADFFPVKKSTGANIMARDPHEARFFGTLLKENNYITDPMEAFSRRAARRTREVNTYNSWVTRIKQMGRVVTDAESIPEGWVAVSPDALFLKHRIHLQFIEKMEDYRLNGLDPDAAFARALEDVGHRTLDDLDTLIGEGKPTVYAIPKALDDEIGAAAKWAKAGGGKYVRAGFDPFMNTWRSLVLTGSPRWVVNNILGNTIMGAMQGVKVADVARILGERLRSLFVTWTKKHPQLEAIVGDVLGPEGLREKSLAYQVQQIPYEGLTGSGFFAKQNLDYYKPRLGRDAADTKVGRVVEATRTPGTKSYRAMSFPRKWSEGMRSLNGEIEASFREASFLTAAEKQQGRSAIQRTGRSFWNSEKRANDIAANGWDEASAKAAVAEVDHFFGNYTALGPFERHIIRRWLVPFWGFYKHVVKLISTFPIQYPARANVLRQLSLATEEMIKDYGPLPEWLQSAIPLSPPGDEVSFLRTAGANPFTGVFEDPTQMLSPAIKVALEQFQGESTFTGEPFTDPNVYTPFGSDQSYDLRTLEPVAAPRPGILEHLLQNVPQYTMLKQMIAGGKTYDTSNILQVLMGQGTITDPETGEAKYPTSVIDQLQKFAGFNAQTYDVGAYQENLTEEQQAALAEALRRMGAG